MTLAAVTRRSAQSYRSHHKWHHLLSATHSPLLVVAQLPVHEQHSGAPVERSMDCCAARRIHTWQSIHRITYSCSSSRFGAAPESERMPIDCGRHTLTLGALRLAGSEAQSGSPNLAESGTLCDLNPRATGLQYTTSIGVGNMGRAVGAAGGLMGRAQGPMLPRGDGHDPAHNTGRSAGIVPPWGTVTASPYIRRR